MDIASIELADAPTTALAMACNIAQVVKTLVGRPIHVAMVKGLNKNLLLSQGSVQPRIKAANAAAIAKLLHLLSFLGEV